MGSYTDLANELRLCLDSYFVTSKDNTPELSIILLTRNNGRTIIDCLSSLLKQKNKVFDWDMIFPIRKINFEGIELCGPNKPEEVLESIYGNYMTIPKDSYPRHSSYINLTKGEKELLEELAK